jgi:translation initiation factor 2B subunit (eIF-2B alpha/beta/delta family)
MYTKAVELSGILKGKTIRSVNIETLNANDSTDEITFEIHQGISHRIEGNRIIFTAGEATAVFELLETAEIITNRTEEGFIVVTLAGNGGLQIKCPIR